MRVTMSVLVMMTAGSAGLVVAQRPGTVSGSKTAAPAAGSSARGAAPSAPARPTGAIRGTGVGAGAARQGAQRGATQHGARRTVIVPYGIPFYAGYYGSNGYSPEEPAPPPPPASSPIVVINRNFQTERITPAFRDYSDVPLPEAAPQLDAARGPVQVFDNTINNLPERDPDEPTIYLLAFQDGTVIPSLAYWVEGDALRYVTRQHSLNVASLSLIDREFSMKLNRERRVEFSLPR